MKALIEKISSYNLFNYLLPGIIFAYVIDNISDYNVIQENLLIGVFLYYFIGLTISRIGSLIIEPVLKKVKFLKFADYQDYVIYSKEDCKIDLLSESNNMYRTICSLFLCILLVKLYDLFSKHIELSSEIGVLLISILLFVLFLFSYRKQTGYITKRILANKNLKT